MGGSSKMPLEQLRCVRAVRCAAADTGLRLVVTIRAVFAGVLVAGTRTAKADRSVSRRADGCCGHLGGFGRWAAARGENDQEQKSGFHRVTP